MVCFQQAEYQAGITRSHTPPQQDAALGLMRRMLMGTSPSPMGNLQEIPLGSLSTGPGQEVGGKKKKEPAQITAVPS